MGTSGNDKLQEQEKGEVSMASLEPPDGHEYPTGLGFVLLMISLYIAMFLVALVQSKAHTSSPCNLLTRRVCRTN